MGEISIKKLNLSPYVSFISHNSFVMTILRVSCYLKLRINLRAKRFQTPTILTLIFELEWLSSLVLSESQCKKEQNTLTWICLLGVWHLYSLSPHTIKMKLFQTVFSQYEINPKHLQIKRSLVSGMINIFRGIRVNFGPIKACYSQQ